MAVSETHFRFRTDGNAVDTTPTWAAGEDVSVSSGIDPFRLRIALDTSIAASGEFELYAKKNSGSYAAVTTSSTGGVKSYDASSDADNTAIRVPRLYPFSDLQPLDNLLRYNFNAADQTFSDQDQLRAIDKGIEDGWLKVLDTSTGSISIDTNTLKLVNTGTTGSELVAFGNYVPVTSMIGLHIRASSVPTGQSWFGSSPMPWGPPSQSKIIGFWALSGSLYSWSAGFGGTEANRPTQQFMGTYTVGQAVEVLIIAGGYDKDGIPWDGTGSTDNYLYGFSLWVWTGVRWERRGQNNAVSADATTPGNLSFNAGFCVANYNNTIQVSHVVIEDKSLSTSQAPSFRDVSVSSGDSYTGTAEIVAEFKITTLPSVGNIDLMFRHADDNNCWIARVVSDGTLKLIEVTTGTPTERATSSAGAIANGDLVWLRAIGDDVRIFDGGEQGGYLGLAYTSSAHQTDSGVKVSSLGTGGAVGYVVGWNAIGGADLPADAQSRSYSNGRNPATGGATKFITFLGDSLWDPSDLLRASPINFITDALGGGWDFYDEHHGAVTFVDLVVNNWDDAAFAHYNAANARNILMLWAGTNDFYLLGDTAADVETRAQNMLTAAVAVGFEVFFMAMADRNQLGGAISVAEHDTRRAAFNGAMQTWCGSNGVTYVDLGARFLDNAASDNTEYFDDLVHINKKGAGWVARIISPLVEP